MDKKLLDKKAFIVFVTYMVMGSLWIYFTDRFLFETTEDSLIITEIQTQKGFLYVLLSGLVIYFLITYLNTKIKLTYQSYYDLFRHHPSAMLIVSSVSGKIISANRSAHSLFSGKNLLNSMNLNVLITDLSEKEVAIVAPFRKSNQNECVIKKFESEEQVVYLNVYKQGAIDSMPELDLVVLDEVSSMVNYMQEKQELINLLKGYTKATSHNIRRPLSNILGLSEFLKEEGLSSKESFEALAFLRSSALDLDEELKKVSDQSAVH